MLPHTYHLHNFMRWMLPHTYHIHNFMRWMLPHTYHLHNFMRWMLPHTYHIHKFMHRMQWSAVSLASSTALDLHHLSKLTATDCLSRRVTHALVVYITF
jgi:hypothetical protein